jgi:flagellar motor switch protein FliG
MPQQDSQNHNLTLLGAEKAAALLIIMGKDHALKLANFFSKEEIKIISEAASRLKSLDINTVKYLVSDFGKDYVGNGMFVDPENLTEFFENFASIPEENINPLTPESELTASLSKMGLPEFDHIKKFIENESIIISAFFIGTLDDELSAKLLSELEPDLRKQIFKKFLDRKTLRPEFEKLIKSEIIQYIIELNTSDGSEEKIEYAAQIINYFSEETSDDLVDFIESDTPEIAAIIKKSLFKFSSIVDLPKTTRSIVFDGVETDDIVRALGNADDKLKESVFETLSPRNRRMVESEMTRTKFDKEEVDSAQRKIAGFVLSLSKQGKISLSKAEAA